MFKTQPVRGMRDFLPEDMIKRQYVFDKIRSVFERFGFQPLETPAVEYLEILTAKSGKDVEKQIYKFKDLGDRWVGLRFDLTVPLARVIASNPVFRRPFKRYCISRVWRYERPQSGRYREFWQADVDIVGVSDPVADSEVLATAIFALKELGLKDFIVRVNNRKVLEGLCEEVGIKDEEKKMEIFRTVDKLDRLGQEGVRKSLLEIGVEEESVNMIMDAIRIKGRGIESLSLIGEVLGNSNKLFLEGKEELEKLFEYLGYYGLCDNVIFDASLARGLDYYTGNIFEVYLSGYERIGSISGGGRYDKLIGMLCGRDIPAVGISLGVERIIDLMDRMGMFKLPKRKTSVFICYTKDDLLKYAIELSMRMRREGLNTDFDLLGRKLKDLLSYADKEDIPFLVILGEKEMKEGKVVLRYMMEKTQETVTFDECLKKIKKSLEIMGIR
ncbi:MAG: histidine--tRNA ligase [Candidatus Odinarchaeota archaeon]|nr:histidine--tRNA ligase [Candidatus Odinarchaeota archaeon]